MKYEEEEVRNLPTKEAIAVLEDFLKQTPYYGDYAKLRINTATKKVINSLEMYKRMAEEKLKDEDEFKQEMCDHRCPLNTEHLELKTQIDELEKDNITLQKSKEETLDESMALLSLYGKIMKRRDDKIKNKIYELEKDLDEKNKYAIEILKEFISDTFSVPTIWEEECKKKDLLIYGMASMLAKHNINEDICAQVGKDMQCEEFEDGDEPCIKCIIEFFSREYNVPMDVNDSIASIYTKIINTIKEWDKDIKWANADDRYYAIAMLKSLLPKSE